MHAHTTAFSGTLFQFKPVLIEAVCHSIFKVVLNRLAAVRDSVPRIDGYPWIIS